MCLVCACVSLCVYTCVYAYSFTCILYLSNTPVFIHLIIFTSCSRRVMQVYGTYLHTCKRTEVENNQMSIHVYVHIILLLAHSEYLHLYLHPCLCLCLFLYISMYLHLHLHLHLHLYLSIYLSIHVSKYGPRTPANPNDIPYTK